MPRRETPQIGRQVFTVPNVLSLLRLFMVPLVVLLLLGRDDLAAVIVFVLAAATDFFDGVLARRTQPTLVGKILDPVADRLMLSSTAIVLAVLGSLPVWAVAILVVRDLFGLVGGLAFGRNLSVNRAGKAATALLMVAIALIMFEPRRSGGGCFLRGVRPVSAGGAHVSGKHLPGDGWRRRYLKAVIMAGGQGTRLRPLTSNQPKPMIPIVGIPCMEHIVELLKRHGFTDIVVTLQFMPEEIRDYFGDGSDWGVDIKYSVEETPARNRGLREDGRGPTRPPGGAFPGY